MARYSSDSDSDRSGKYRKKHYRRSRSSSSESSDSSSYRKRTSKYSKSRRRHRSSSRTRQSQRTSTSYKSSPGSSKDRDRRKYKSRKSKSQSPDRNKKKVRSVSREKSTSRSSSSQSYIKTTVDKSSNILGKDEFTIEPRIKEGILEEINADSFTPKQFTSSAQSKDKKSNKNIVIDITTDSIQMPLSTASNPPIIQDSIFHSSIITDHEIRFDKWVKKLYNLRQKAIADVMSIVT